MLIHDAVGAGGSILELGCGPGRITRFLIALGHEVTAVDDSPAMLEHVTGARTVSADLYTLELDHAEAADGGPGVQYRDRPLRARSPAGWAVPRSS